MKFNPETPEQVLELKDGRTLFKTHNGFKAFVKKKDEVTAITHAYYNKSKHLAV